MGAARRVLKTHGNADKPLWVTEAGFTTSGAGRVDEGEQARRLLTTYRTLRAAPDVDAVIFHTLVDPGGAPDDPEAGFGILRRDLTPKPAYCALAAEQRTGFRC